MSFGGTAALHLPGLVSLGGLAAPHTWSAQGISFGTLPARARPQTRRHVRSGFQCHAPHPA
eukprot:1813678-Alexandrium_andersonii.AAC.1